MGASPGGVRGMSEKELPQADVGLPCCVVPAMDTPARNGNSLAALPGPLAGIQGLQGQAPACLSPYPSQRALRPHSSLGGRCIPEQTEFLLSPPQGLNTSLSFPSAELQPQPTASSLSSAARVASPIDFTGHHRDAEKGPQVPGPRPSSMPGFHGHTWSSQPAPELNTIVFS